MRHLLPLVILLSACHYSAGYDNSGDYGYDGGMGATPGGAQDIGYFRELVALGYVPQPEDLTVEGLLSEHDLPVVGPPCEDLLCVRPALGVAPSLSTGEAAHWIQLGLTSGLPSPYVRPPMDLVVTIDRSDAMGIDMEQVEEAVARLVHAVGPEDRVAIVTFAGSVDVLHPLSPITDPDAVEADVRRLEARGDWDVDAAMARSYDLLRDAGDDPSRLRRVALLTCGYPAVSGADPFSVAVKAAAEERIGTSVYGVLLGWDPALADLLGETRGGSYSYLVDLPDVERMFDTELDAMMSPLAYDLHLELSLGGRYAIDRLYGIPGDPDGAPRAGFDVATAFVSHRKGAIFARLLPTEPVVADDTVATVALAYEPESAHGFSGATEAEERVIEPGGSIGDGSYFQSPGVRKGVALVNEAEQLEEACRDYHAGRRDEAITTATALRDHLLAESAEVDGLAAEVALVEKLIENLGG